MSLPFCRDVSTSPTPQKSRLANVINEKGFVID
jgi:hypothetical protein